MKKRLLILGPLPPPYVGPEVMTKTLVEALRRDSDVNVRHINTQVSRSVQDKGGKRTLAKAPVALWQALQVVVEILRFRPDIVYLPLTNSPQFLGFLRDAVLMLMPIALRRRFAFRLHGGYYYYAHCSGWKRRLVGWFLARVHLAMVQGNRLTDEFDGLIPLARIRVIPNGLESRPFDDAKSRSSQGDSVPTITVLFVGSLCREKGVYDIVVASRDIPGARFVFLGDWVTEEFQSRILALADVLGTRQRLEFRGVVTGPTKYDLFCSADIFLFPSYYPYEGHAVSSVEALAAGLPVVCTDHGALTESVEDGWNGFLIPKSDPAAIAERINWLIAHPDVRAAMGERSRYRFDERFTIDHFVTNWKAAIVDAIER